MSPPSRLWGSHSDNCSDGCSFEVHIAGWGLMKSKKNPHIYIRLSSQVEFVERVTFTDGFWSRGEVSRSVPTWREIKCLTTWGLNWFHYHMNSSKTKNSLRLWTTFLHSQRSVCLAAAWFMLSGCHNCSAITGTEAVRFNTHTKKNHVTLTQGICVFQLINTHSGTIYLCLAHY